jgi:hypothetical protein
MARELPGEADLRGLALRFEQAERRVRALLARAPEGNRRELVAAALTILIALRGEDFRTPVIAAYLAAFRVVRRGGDGSAARDLAGSLAQKLDGGVQTASARAREAFRAATQENLEIVVHDAVTAHIDDRGTRWTLEGWADMNTATIGRQASTRGLSDAVGAGRKVIVEVTGCGYCQEFAGEAVVGTDPLPPFHPSCTCMVSAA